MVHSCAWIICSVVLGSYTQFAWVIYTVVLGSYYICLGHLSYFDAKQMIFKKKNFFSIFPKKRTYICTDQMMTYVDYTPKLFRKSPQIKIWSWIRKSESGNHA